MLGKLIPLIVMAVAAVVGVGAGKFLRSGAPVEAGLAAQDTAPAQADVEEPAMKKNPVKEPGVAGPLMDYVKLNNQFVVPIVEKDRVTSLGVLSLSIEVPEGKQDDVVKREPKVRDSFLQVLFDHANMGGFAGEFTETTAMDARLTARREISQRDLGRDTVHDVLILEIARQDY